MIAEEFTFPVISSSSSSHNVVNLSFLPPLWRISSIHHSDDAESSDGGRKRKIFTGELLKLEASENDAKAEAEAQEKMDVLWENFNEEVRGAHASAADSDFSEETYSNNYRDDNDDRKNRLREEYETLEERSNVQELKLIPAKRRKKLELVLKMVKKLFLLHHSNTAARGPN